jgi:ATP-dependent Clp protease ATP-binding subunit ClpA
MTLELDKKAVAFLVKQGSDEAMGARPLRRAVQRYIEDPLAELLLAETLKAGKIKGTLSKNSDELIFKQ